MIDIGLLCSALCSCMFRWLLMCLTNPPKCASCEDLGQPDNKPRKISLHYEPIVYLMTHEFFKRTANTLIRPDIRPDNLRFCLAYTFVMHCFLFHFMRFHGFNLPYCHLTCDWITSNIYYIRLQCRCNVVLRLCIRRTSNICDSPAIYTVANRLT